MIRIRLTDAQRSERQALRGADLPAVARSRLEMVLLSDAGWSAPRIASHLGCHPPTARAALKGYALRGSDALSPQAPGPAPDAGRRGRVAAALDGLLGEDRVWTSRQLAEALRLHGVALGGRQVRRYLAAAKAGYRRTAQTVGHKQDPAATARGGVVLEALEKKPRRAS